MSVMLNNLTTGATYNILVVAYTRVGAGPYSQPVLIFLTNIAHQIDVQSKCSCFVENQNKSTGSSLDFNRFPFTVLDWLNQY